MLKKTSIGVLVVALLSTLLITGINFTETKAMGSGNTGTIVSGLISENTTWTIDESPYIVVGDVFIEENVFLTINPGVTVKFDGAYSLVVRGALVAKGNCTHMITFTSNKPSPQIGDWGRIYFTRMSIEAANALDWVIVEYGGAPDYGWHAIALEERSLNITNSILRFNNIAISCYGNVRLIIQNCTIVNNKLYGIDAQCLYTEIYDCIICYNGEGISGLKGGPNPPPIPSIKIYNSILNNNEVAICQDKHLLYLVNCTVAHNADGIVLKVGTTQYVYMVKSEIRDNYGSGVIVEPRSFSPLELQIIKSTIADNKDNGLIFKGGVGATTLDVHFSNIFNNTPYDIVNNFTYGINVNATFNWWGTTNETLIEEHIYDYYDDYSKGKVFYKPYLVPPIANFTFSPETLYAYGTVTFNASPSFNPYGSIIKYTWDFGDGNTTTIISPIIAHVYSAPSTYNATLTVTDEFGLTNSTVTSFTVHEDDVPPVTVDDYDGEWRNADFTITLTGTDYESGVAETYYRINDGPDKAVSIDGQPYITTEGANNTLEYWSVDNVGNEELPHKILTGINLDKTFPAIGIPSRIPEGDVQPDQVVKVSVSVTDFGSEVKNVTLSYNLNDSTVWINLPMVFNSTTELYETTINIQQANTLVRYKITAYDNAGNQAVNDNQGNYYTYRVIQITHQLTITSTEGGTTNPAPGTYTYVNGTVVSVMALPDVDYSFGYWRLEGEVRTVNPIIILVAADGTLEAFFVDDIPPDIGSPVQDTSEDVEPYQNVTVTISVTDLGTGVYNVTLWYSIDNGITWIPQNMTEFSPDTYQATISGQPADTLVKYKTTAYDNAGNCRIEDNNGTYYAYTVIPEFPSFLILPLLMIATLLAVIAYRRKRVDRR